MVSPQGIGFPINFSNGGIEVIDTPTNAGLNTFEEILDTANTTQQLPAILARNFIIITNKSSSDVISIGSGNHQFIQLSPNQSLFIDVHEAPLNVNWFFFIGPNAGDVVGVTVS